MVDDWEFDCKRFRIPPKELEEMLPQQLLMLRVMAGAVDDAGVETEEANPRAGVFIGIALDLNTTNYHVRWSLPESERDAAMAPLTANRTIGALGGFLSELNGLADEVSKPDSVNIAMLRNVATEGLFTGLDRASQLTLINKNVRRIARVVIEPRFRGIGLAQRLLRETMPLMNVPIVEALAVMGRINPFFEKANMQSYEAPMPLRNIRLIEALGSVGIEERTLLSPRKMQDRIDMLDSASGEFIERETSLFLESFGKRRDMQPGLNRTEYLLTKLTDRPTYYVWFNDEMDLRI